MPGRLLTQRSWLIWLAVAMTMAALLGSAPHAWAVTDPIVSIAVTPKGLLTGDQVTATGTASTAVVRTAQLQRQDGTAWPVVASASTTSAGAYTLKDPVTRTGAYRVVLPVAGTRPAITSETRTVIPAAMLENGRTLARGQYLTSRNGAWRLTMRTDGNLVLTQSVDPGTVVWSTKTAGNDGARLVMQYRGNLVLVGSDGALLWNTGTANAKGYLALYSTGNIVVRAGAQMLWDRDNGVHQAADPTTTAQSAVRGQSWVDSRVRYSQSAYYSNKYGKYRTDCSGFISEMWALKSSYTTRTLPSISTVITKGQLTAGDILNAPGYHGLMFEKWADSAKTQYWAYEMSPSSGAAHHVVPYPYWKSSRPGSFVLRRLDPAAAARVAASNPGARQVGVQLP